MSDIYPTGRGRPVHPAGARPGRHGPRDLPPGRQRPAPGRVAPARRHLPDLRQGRDDDRHAVGRRAGVLRVPARPRHLGPRLRGVGLDLAVRRERQAALEPRVGGPVEPLRGDDRAVRQGPLDRRRLARPLRRDRPRGLRARAAAQRPVRVPQHRRPEDVHLQGPRRRRPTSSPRSCPPEQLRLLFLRPRPNSAIEFDPEGTDAIPRLFDEFDKLAAATAGREVKGEPAGRPESIFRYSLLDPDAGRRGRGGRLPGRLQPPRPARPDPRRRPRRAGRGGEGQPAHRRARRTILDERVAAARALARRPTRRSAPGSTVRRDGLPAEADALERRPAGLPGWRWPTPSRRPDRRPATPGRR